MTDITRSALVHHSAERMFGLVRDVDSYAAFLNWCSEAHVISEEGGHQRASIGVEIKGVRQRFTTANVLHPSSRIEMRLEEGPFRELYGEWRFTPLGETGSKVELWLTFEFASKLLAFAFQRGFTRVADHLVDDFHRRADALYG